MEIPPTPRCQKRARGDFAYVREVCRAFLSRTVGIEYNLRIEHWIAGVTKCEDPLTPALSPKMGERAGVRDFRINGVEQIRAAHVRESLSNQTELLATGISASMQGSSDSSALSPKYLGTLSAFRL